MCYGIEYLDAALSAHGRRVIVTDRGEAADDAVREMVEVLTLMYAHAGRPRRAESSDEGG